MYETHSMSFLICTFVGYLQTSRIKCTKQCKLGQSFLFYFTSSEPGMGKTSSLALVALEWAKGKFSGFGN